MRVIEQTALQAGENEISASQRLLGKVDLTTKIISGDAMVAQQELSKQCLKKAVNTCGNCELIKGKYTNWRKHILPAQTDKYLAKAVSLEKGHGRA